MQGFVCGGRTQELKELARFPIPTAAHLGLVLDGWMMRWMDEEGDRVHFATFLGSF